MKQILQNVCHGKLSIETLPEPAVQPLQVKIANQFSVISAGTEKTARELAQKTLIVKARTTCGG